MTNASDLVEKNNIVITLCNKREGQSRAHAAVIEFDRDVTEIAATSKVDNSVKNVP